MNAWPRRRLLLVPACLAVLLTALLAGARPAAATSTTLKVQAVPRVEGVLVSLDGRTFRTDARGGVVIRTTAGRHLIRLQPPRALPAGTSLRFSGWLDHSPLMERVITVSPKSDRQEIGFILSYSMPIRVTDPQGEELPASRISRITMASSIGERFTLRPGEERSFASNRIVRNQDGLVSVPIRYSTREVLLDGTNVVYGGSQSFYARASSVWTIEALLFPLRVEVRDALFGFPIGGTVRLTLPNGSSRTVGLESDHGVNIRDLPRGTYELVAHGLGIGLSSPLALSRPQIAKLLLLSWVDIAAVVAFAVLFVVGLPLAGRRIGRPAHGRLPLVWRTGGTRAPVRVTMAKEPDK